MRIPESFKQAQKRVFQDKIMYRYKAKNDVGGLGSVVTEPDYDTVVEYAVNVQFVSDAAVAEEYGLRIGTDISITTSSNISVEKGDYIKYLDDLYRVTESPRYDSHFVYLAKRE